MLHFYILLCFLREFIFILSVFGEKVKCTICDVDLNRIYLYFVNDTFVLRAKTEKIM